MFYFGCCDKEHNQKQLREKGIFHFIVLVHYEGKSGQELEARTAVVIFCLYLRNKISLKIRVQS